MRTRISLFLVAASAGGAAFLLSRLALAQHHELDGLPLSAWGPSQLSAATLAPLCLLAALAAAWHALSALAALAACLPQALPASWEAASPALACLSRQAGLLVGRWGAPVVRRLVAGALVASLGTAPALAAEQVTPDYLGWQPTQTASSAAGTSETTSPPEAPADPEAAGPTEDEEPGARTGGGVVEGQEPPQPTATQTAPEVEPATSPKPSPKPSPGRGAAPSQAEAGTGPHKPGTSARASGHPGTHVVVVGDSLWSLSAHYLGDAGGPQRVAQAWPLLYEANRDVIGQDPALIQPGTTLVLPESLTTP